MTEEEYVRRFFDDDGFVKLLGMEILELSEERAVVRAAIHREHLNANGSAQGGMLYSVADYAFALYANYQHPMTVTQGGSIRYVRAACTKYVTAVAKETVRAGHNTVSEVIIYDDQGEIVCVCNFNGFVKDVDRESWTWKMKNTGEDK